MVLCEIKGRIPQPRRRAPSVLGGALQRSPGPSRGGRWTAGGPANPSASSRSPNSGVPRAGAWGKHPLPRLPSVAKWLLAQVGGPAGSCFPLALFLCLPNGASVLRSTGSWGCGQPGVRQLRIRVGPVGSRFLPLSRSLCLLEPQFPHL